MSTDKSNDEVFKAIGTQLDYACDDFRARSKRAREVARRAWRSGDKAKHNKFSAVARVWTMAAQQIEERTAGLVPSDDDDLPF